MRLTILILAVTCSQNADCNGRRERTYRIDMQDGSVIETCGYSHQWVEAACVQILDSNGAAVMQRCGVRRVEFGVVATPPPPEDPKGATTP
jgi:hypothetical protein